MFRYSAKLNELGCIQRVYVKQHCRYSDPISGESRCDAEGGEAWIALDTGT